ncbi:hypothetical protein KTS45_14575 [Halomicroarcula limicola]|uniref:Asparagine synthetase domain-containing protein n=1 Tax=Haloarcula limicola TaxID=1429915 RepID=A0A8J7YCM3_9EURY|nr:asparagine synthase-related protein [Halomicroarcula limicola]MBV0925429.1 hypothetical protein [Halomicroarcula limicola]
MTGSFRLLVADPAARTLETDTGTWVVAGVDVSSIERVLRDAGSVAEVKRELPSVTEDAIAVNVEDDSGRTVHAYRSVTGGHRLYWTETNGEFVLADHFRNALAEVPVGERTVSDETVIDHLLFRAPVGATGFVEEVDGVEQGEWRTWHLDSGETTSERVGTLSTRTETPPSRAPAAIESTYDDLMATDGFDGDAINLYSGGVDSTLTQTFFEGSTMLNAGVDSEEYAYEVEYAREGADHFDAPFEQEMIPEADVLEHLEDSIDATGSPSCPLQVLMVNEALRQYSGRRYVMAVGADSIFGNTPMRGPRYADWASPLLNTPLSRGLARYGPGPVGGFVEWMDELDAQLDRPIDDADSFAHQYATYSNPGYAKRLFDPSLVDDRVAAQTEYVTERVPLDDTHSRFARQAECRHMNLVFGHRVGARWRQLAMAHGNTLTNPFETRSMIETSLSIPAERRFVSGPRHLYDVSTKHHLKQLLRDRLPEYPIGQPKGAGVLPFQRYLRSGPLSSAFETYEPPAFVPDDERESVIEGSGRQSWNVLTYAIWRDRVLENADLPRLSTTEERTWTVPERSASQSSGESVT